MVWSEPTGIDVLIPGDKDVSNPTDTRDYILLTGALPAEVSSNYDTAIVWFNGKFDPAKTGQQIKYFLIGSKDNVMQHAVGLYANGTLTFTALSGESMDLSTTPPTARSILGRVNSDPALAQLPGVKFANFAQAPLADWIHKDQIHKPPKQFIANSVLYDIIGNFKNGYSQDPSRELVGIYKDVTGRCWMNGWVSVAAGFARSVGFLNLAQTGPWAPTNENARARAFTCPVYIEATGDAHACMVYIGAGRDLVIIHGTTYNNVNPVVINLSAINWQVTPLTV